MKKHTVFRRIGALMLTAALAAGLCTGASAASFSDVPDSHWAAPSIRRCVELGYFHGESAASFGAGKPMTRAAFVTALCRLFGWDTAASAAAPYGDVAPDAWYAGAVASAYANVAVTTQSSRFRPDDAITREELAVMLVRALGYTTISALSAEHPFTDVDSSAGYIAMAYDMGLVAGTSPSAFSPDAPATREQAAVILMRLSDKLRAAAPAAMALITAWPQEGMALSGWGTVAIGAGRLALAGSKPILSRTMSERDIAAAKSAAGSVPVLLYVSAGKAVVQKADPAAVAAVVSAAVEGGGYDGVYLDVTGVPASAKSAMTALARAVDGAVGGKLFYLGAEGPSLSGGETGYDHAALALAADELVVSVTSPVVKSGSFTAAPPEPLEELYACLSALKDIPNLTVRLSAQGTAWRGTTALSAPRGSDIEDYLAQGALRYYSQRYGCPYLRLADGRTVWYHDGESAAARLQLLQLFGADRLCLADAQTATADLLKGLGLG